jgi:acid phosphatase type 7
MSLVKRSKSLIKPSLLCLLLACSAGATLLWAADVVGGPFVVNAIGRSATIAWVEREADAQVAETGAPARSVPVLRSRHISLSGLKPGATVAYAAFPGEAGKGSFKVPPAPTSDAPYQFVVFGDTRTRHELHKRVIAAVIRANPDFVFHTGDLVQDGYDTLQWPVFFDIERELLRKAAFYPVLGNHERNNRQFYDYFDVGSPYYSFNWGNAHFALLNSDLGNAVLGKSAREAYWKAQLEWLEEDLAANQKAAFRFIVMHHPPFTAVGGRQTPDNPMRAIVPLSEKYNVAAVFAGHDHNYQHHLLNGVHYVVTGGGGAPLYPVDRPIDNITRKVESIEHYVSIQVTGKTAAVRARALDDRLIEEFALDAGAGK